MIKVRKSAFVVSMILIFTTIVQTNINSNSIFAQSEMITLPRQNLTYKELFAEIESLGEGEIVIAKNGEYYETIDKVSMSFYHDTKHYVIGVLSL